MESPYGVAIVAIGSEVPAGFVVGATDVAAHRRYTLRHHGLRLAGAGVLALAVRPAVAAEFARTRVIRYARALLRPLLSPTTSGPGAAAFDRPAVLAHVAVASDHEGTGIGRALVDAFCDETRRRGASMVELATLSGEDGAAGFYERLGWVPVSEPQSGEAFRRFRRQLQ